MKKYIPICLFLLFGARVQAQLWHPDLGNGTYQNPILFADYSDPDVIRVGEDYYLVASSFNCMPGIPILHSKDLVNWTIIGHVYDRLPLKKYDKPVHGEGCWAPSIRFHAGLFYVYFCTPYDGLFMASAKEPAGPWSLHQVARVELWEDPCPFWDDDGNAYLIRSQLCGTPLYIHRMSPDGKELLDNGILVFRDEAHFRTLEGPKLMKKDGLYYIFAPAGGVPQGWQTVLRSKNIYGPYETKIVLHQGSTDINGPHQGGLVDTKSGEWWFMHFQDRDAYGRIVHLQPTIWQDGWPLMGQDIDQDGIGEPVSIWQKPEVGISVPIAIPQISDEFGAKTLGLQWQWQANPQDTWFSLSENPNHLRLYAIQNLIQFGNLWFAPNLLLQKFPAPVFSAATHITFFPEQPEEKGGLVVMGEEWACLAMEKTSEGLRLSQFVSHYNRCQDGTRRVVSVDAPGNSCYLKVHIAEGGICTFTYSVDGKAFLPIGTEFKAVKGRWIGAKVGLFCINPNVWQSQGYADFEWFRLE